VRVARLYVRARFIGDIFTGRKYNVKSLPLVLARLCDPGNCTVEADRGPVRIAVEYDGGCVRMVHSIVPVDCESREPVSLYATSRGDAMCAGCTGSCVEFVEVRDVE